MTRCLVFTILLIAFFPVECLSEPASDETMADEAISPYVPRDPGKRDKALEKQIQILADHAAQSPDEIQPATVFFKTGLSYRELHDLRNDFGFEVIDVGMKAPQGDRGVVMSVSGGMADLFATTGTFEERLTFMITSEQKCFAKMVKYMPADESQGMADLATNPFFVYSARIFGPNRTLGELQQQPIVRSIILNLEPSIISDFEWAKSHDGPHRYFMPGFFVEDVYDWPGLRCGPHATVY